LALDALTTLGKAFLEFFDLRLHVVAQSVKKYIAKMLKQVSRM
jgi:hypothetical protein